MGAYLCFMGVRLIAMRRLLKPTGSIYLHCDPTASHYLKMLMDAIFGRDNFRNEIVWFYRRWAASSGRFQRMHDIILFYSKTRNATFNVIYVPTSETRSKMSRGYNTNTYKDSDGIRRRQIIVEDTVAYEESVKNGTVNPNEYDAVVFRKSKGTPAFDVIEMPIINPQAKERTGYPTQKPLKLYERLIEASSNKGDLILDPFAGCATTCVAAEKLERQWVGIDIWKEASEIVVDRLEQNGLIAPKYTRKKKKSRQRLLFAREMYFTPSVPRRTDGGETDVPYLKTKNKLKQDEVSDGLTNHERKQRLLDTKGSICQGCGRKFDDPRYLELDHNNPRADGGSNNISNRILLCSPCNRLKSHTYTLSGLIDQNNKQGYMKNPKLVESLRR